MKFSRADRTRASTFIDHKLGSTRSTMGGMRRLHLVALAVGVVLVVGVSLACVKGRRGGMRGAPIIHSPTNSPSSTDQIMQDESLQPDDERLDCRLSVYELLKADDDSGVTQREKLYMCSPLVDGKVTDREYQIALDDATRQVYHDRADDELEMIVSIKGGRLDEDTATVVIPEGVAITQHDPLKHKIRRKLVETEGTMKALGVLVNLRDASPVYSAPELYKFLFQDSVSLKNQYKACSFGKFVVEPSSRGVIEVTVDLSSTTSNQQTVVNAASTAALKYLYDNGAGTFSNLQDYADMVLFVTPDMGNWLAYASVGGGISVYNCRWGGYIASLMHETGHNLNLLHAHEGKEYEDYTGYMGGAVIGYHDRVGFPRMCYNAANHWQLGWFADRAITVDMFKPTLIKIAAFAHYDKTTEGEEYVVVRSGNVYMHYNRATGVNVDTTEYKDHLTIYQAISDGTFLFAALDYETKPLYQRSFSQGTWHAEICDQVFGDGYNTPDYLLVSTGFGESLCSQQVQTKYVSNGLSITVSTSSSSSTLQKSVGQSRVRGGESRALSEINFVQ